MRQRWTITLLALIVVAGCDQPGEQATRDTQAPSAPVETTPVSSRLDPQAARPIAYRLDLEVDPRAPAFIGSGEIDVELGAATETIVMHGRDLRISEAAIGRDGEWASARFEQIEPLGRAILHTPPQAPGRVTLRFKWSAPYQQGPAGLYRTRIGRNSYVFSQLQPIDARRVFPSFDDPQFKTPFDVSVTTRKGHIAVTNTRATDSEQLQGNLVRFRYATAPPMPTYLFALAAGTFDVRGGPTLRRNDRRERLVSLRGFATRGKRDQLAFALRATPTMVDWLEAWFDYPFPWPKLDLIASPQFGYSAMENAGAIIYGDPLLLVNETSGARALQSFGDVHGHELAHHWFGNLVTMKWWEDTWLNEAFANWMGKKVGHAWRPDLGIDTTLISDALSVMDRDSRAATRPIRRAVRTDADIAGSFDYLTYAKGSGLLNMFEAWLGPERFQAGVRAHIERFAGGSADLNDFMGSLADGADARELVPAMRSFLEQPGVPLLDVHLQCDGAPTLVVTQSRYLPLGSREPTNRSWQVPMCASWLEGGTEHRQCELLGRVRSEIVLEATACPEAVMPNAGGLGYYRFNLPPQRWLPLLEGLPTLETGAALAALDSLGASFRAGRVDLASLLQGAAISARSDDPQVAGSLLGELRWIYVEFGEALGRKALREQLINIYEPVLQALGARPERDPAEEILAARVAGFLALTLDHIPTRDLLAREALDHLVGRQGADVTLRRVALQSGLRRDPGLEEQYVLYWLDSEDARLRSDIAAALASTQDPLAVRGLLARLLDREVRPQEVQQIIVRLMQEPAHRDQVLTWLERNYRKVAERQGSLAQQAMPRLTAAACATSQRERIQEMYRTAPESLAVGEALDRTLEDIDLCVALGRHLSTAAEPATDRD